MHVQQLLGLSVVPDNFALIIFRRVFYLFVVVLQDQVEGFSVVVAADTTIAVGGLCLKTAVALAFAVAADAVYVAGGKGSSKMLGKISETRRQVLPLVLLWPPLAVAAGAKRSGSTHK